VYPARFECHAPASLDEALALLERYGDEGKVLAGGQSLIPLMKLRFASPRALVDLNRIQGLDAEAVDPVCGMTVAVEGAAERIEHEGALVVFCSVHCRKQFEAEQARYGGLRAR
jgi:aerobic carbon-monoxide dehydrogenase medium subunit